MATVTPAELRLLVIPDRRAILSRAGVALAATSEAGPAPGVVTADQTTTAQLAASGTIDSELVDIILSTTRAGGAGQGAVRWRHAGETARSSDPPTAVSEFEFVSRSVTAQKYRKPHACRRSNGRVVVVATDATSGVTSWAQGTDGKWTSATVASTSAQTRACIAELPSGRLICIYTRSTGSGTTQLQMSYSDDGGLSWTVGSTACIGAPIASASSTVERLRIAVLGSEVLVLAWVVGAVQDEIKQYASTDQGSTFALIETLKEVAYPRACFDLAVRAGVCYMAVLKRVAGIISVPTIRTLATARTPLSSAEETVVTMDPGGVTPDAAKWATLTGVYFTDSELAILADDDGTLYIYGRDVHGSATNEAIIRMSVDAGKTWIQPPDTTAPFASSANSAALCVAKWGVSTTYLRDICIVAERGRAIMLHRAVASSAVAAVGFDSLMATYLGGWTTVAMPESSAYAYRAGVGGWDVTWLPIEFPENVGWTRTVAGAPTASFGTNGLGLSQGAGESTTYSRVPTVVSTAGILCAGHIMVTSGTGTVDLTISNGAINYQLRLHVSPTEIWMTDPTTGPVAFGLKVNTTEATNGIEWLICVDAPAGYVAASGRARGWWRAAGAYATQGPKADRQWSAITGSTTMALGAVAASRVAWGQIAAGVGSEIYKWLGFSAGSYIAGGDGLADPARGRQIQDRTSPIHLEKGLRIAATSGPLVMGNTFAHATSHAYPVEAVDVSFAPSPARTWRSTSSAQQDITITCDAGFRAGDLFAIYVDNCNIRQLTAYYGAGLTKIMDMDLALGTGLDFTRSRDLVTSALSGAALPFYLREGSMDGGTFALSAGVRRRIRHTRGGVWKTNAFVPEQLHTELEIEGYQNADPASGIGELWAPSGLFLTTLMQSTNLITIRIPTQVTADGYMEIGTLMVGRVCVLGRQYGWGRTDETSSQVVTSTLRGGGRRRRQLGDQRRAVEINWSSGVAMQGLYGASTDTMSIYSGGPAHGDVAGTLPLVRGVLSETLGGALPCVLAMRVPTQAIAPTATAPITVLDPAMLLYGSVVTETWQAANVLGKEGTDPGEVMRGGVLRIEQEL